MSLCNQLRVKESIGQMCKSNSKPIVYCWTITYHTASLNHIQSIRSEYFRNDSRMQDLGSLSQTSVNGCRLHEITFANSIDVSSSRDCHELSNHAMWLHTGTAEFD